jgi:hypothetical protein
MDTNQINRLVAKISGLLQESGQSGKLSKIDRDVLLAYIRNLYEMVLEADQSSVEPVHSPAATVVPAVETPQATPVAPTVIHVETPAQPFPVDIPDPSPAPVQIPAQATTPVEEFTQAEVQPVTIEAAAVQPAPPVEEAAVQPVIVEAQPVQPVSPVQSPPNLPSEALNEIFAELTIRDLSDKLALSPIQDLSKAMGLNEKVLTQQELFGNNAQVFQDAMQYMNQCRTFAEAKQYLMEHIIVTYHWTSDAKVKKAANFVKLVRRRFH